MTTTTPAPAAPSGHPAPPGRASPTVVSAATEPGRGAVARTRDGEPSASTRAESLG